MHELFFELQRQLNPVLRSGDLERCELTVSQQLVALPKSPFHILLNLSITNSSAAVANLFDEFINREGNNFSIAACYTETNGFAINPNRWYFSLFAYKGYGGHEDYDWLANWDSRTSPEMTITGLEPLQAVYASDDFRSNQFIDACDMASLLVVIRFQDLIRRAAAQMKLMRFPLLATAHDYDFILEFDPPSARKPEQNGYTSWLFEE